MLIFETVHNGGVEYYTIAQPIETELEISRSRFLTRLARVENEDEARDEIASVRVAHPKARHHCTAYVIGADGRVKRSNDDGEPSGTAGAPMLDALVAAELSDVVAVVTRYFGGILLGAGGLTRAYRAAVAEATAKAKRVTRAERQEVAVVAAYDAAPNIEVEARRRGITVFNSDYAEYVTLHFAVAEEDLPTVQSFVAEHSAGSAELILGATAYVDL